MNRGPSEGNRWPIDESLGSYRENMGFMGQVVDILFSWRRAKDVQWLSRYVEESLTQKGIVGR